MSELKRSADAYSAERAAFVRQGYALLPALLEPALTAFLWSYAHSRFASRSLMPGDRLIPFSPAAYGDLAFDGLLEYLRPRVEERSGYELIPTYSYFRIYKHGDALERHRDRPACEISVSVNIGQEPANPWPLHIEGKTGVYAALLSPGDGLLYRGIDHAHWREPFDGKRLVQVFLHYVDRSGPHTDQKFDQRITLMRPKERDAEDADI